MEQASDAPCGGTSTAGAAAPASPRSTQGIAAGSRSGPMRWGIKEVRWTSDDARYPRWLYPHSRLVFLYPDPWKAYRSYRRRGGDRHDTYPDRRVFTATQFGRHWRTLTEGFLPDAAVQQIVLVAVERQQIADAVSPLAGAIGYGR